MQSTAWSKDLRVTADGTGVVSHVGTALLRMLADRTGPDRTWPGLTGALSAALARTSAFLVHDRGRVLADLALMIADGGKALCDIDVLRHQGAVFRCGRLGHHRVAGPGRDRRDSAAADRGGPGEGPGPAVAAVWRPTGSPGRLAGTSAWAWWCWTWTPPS